MHADLSKMIRIILGVALFVSTEAFFMKWSSDNTRQPPAPKTWIQPLPPGMIPAYRAYSYSYMPYDQRKIYQMPPQYQPEPMAQSMAPIPISVPAGANLTPVSLQHVQLVPCMCPVAPEEAEKLQESVGPGPYLAQTFQGQGYSAPQAEANQQPKH